MPNSNKTVGTWPMVTMRIGTPSQLYFWGQMEAVDSHRDHLKPLFDVVSFTVIELTAHLAMGEDSR